jgi:hypothetical protein
MQAAVGTVAASPRFTSASGQRSSWVSTSSDVSASPPSRKLGASYDSVAANGSRQQQQQQQQQQHRGMMSPLVRRAAVVPPPPPHRASDAPRIPRLGLSFDESQSHSVNPPLPPPRRLLSQSTCSPHDAPHPAKAQGWTLGASVYCRFVVDSIRELRVPCSMFMCFALCPSIGHVQRL